MKKLLILALSSAMSLGAMAEGYQVNSFSAKQNGMGHVGVAMKLGAESQIFNPAAVTFMNKTMEISGSVSGISSSVTATYQNNKYKTSSDVATPLNLSAAFRIYDNLYAGVSLYTPYGSCIDWGYNWPGAALNQSVKLQVFAVQPTFSWKILPNLSVGAGFVLSWGNVDLNKGLISTSSFDAVLPILNQAYGTSLPAADGISPANVNIKGTAELAAGFNVGAMWDITDQWTLGVSYRSKMMMKVKNGDATITPGKVEYQPILTALGIPNYANFNAEMPCPSILTFGISYKPIKNLILAFDAQLNGWGTYKYLDFTFPDYSAFDQHLKKDYHNAMTYHLGAQYGLTERFDVRCGLMVDTSPCNKDYYNPETPGTTKIEPTVGLSFRPVTGLSIDLSFMYVYGCKVKNAIGEYDDFIASSFPMLSLSPIGHFEADYKLHAFIPAIGLSYSF